MGKEVNVTVSLLRNFQLLDGKLQQYIGVAHKTIDDKLGIDGTKTKACNPLGEMEGMCSSIPSILVCNVVDCTRPKHCRILNRTKKIYVLRHFSWTL